MKRLIIFAFHIFIFTFPLVKLFANEDSPELQAARIKIKDFPKAVQEYILSESSFVAFGGNKNKFSLDRNPNQASIQLSPELYKERGEKKFVELVNSFKDSTNYGYENPAQVAQRLVKSLGCENSLEFLLDVGSRIGRGDFTKEDFISQFERFAYSDSKLLDSSQRPIVRDTSKVSFSGWVDPSKDATLKFLKSYLLEFDTLRFSNRVRDDHLEKIRTSIANKHDPEGIRKLIEEGSPRLKSLSFFDRSLIERQPGNYFNFNFQTFSQQELAYRLLDKSSPLLSSLSEVQKDFSCQGSAKNPNVAERPVDSSGKEILKDKIIYEHLYKVAQEQKDTLSKDLLSRFDTRNDHIANERLEEGVLARAMSDNTVERLSQDLRALEDRTTAETRDRSDQGEFNNKKAIERAEQSYRDSVVGHLSADSDFDQKFFKHKKIAAYRGIGEERIRNIPVDSSINCNKFNTSEGKNDSIAGLDTRDFMFKEFRKKIAEAYTKIPIVQKTDEKDKSGLEKYLKAKEAYENYKAQTIANTSTLTYLLCAEATGRTVAASPHYGGGNTSEETIVKTNTYAGYVDLMRYFNGENTTLTDGEEIDHETNMGPFMVSANQFYIFKDTFSPKLIASIREYFEKAHWLLDSSGKKILRNPELKSALDKGRKLKLEDIPPITDEQKAELTKECEVDRFFPNLRNETDAQGQPVRDRFLQSLYVSLLRVGATAKEEPLLADIALVPKDYGKSKGIQHLFTVQTLCFPLAHKIANQIADVNTKYFGPLKKKNRPECADVDGTTKLCESFYSSIAKEVERKAMDEINSDSGSGSLADHYRKLLLERKYLFSGNVAPIMSDILGSTIDYMQRQKLIPDVQAKTLRENVAKENFQESLRQMQTALNGNNNHNGLQLLLRSLLDFSAATDKANSISEITTLFEGSRDPKTDLPIKGAEGLEQQHPSDPAWVGFAQNIISRWGYLKPGYEGTYKAKINEHIMGALTGNVVDVLSLSKKKKVDPLYEYSVRYEDVFSELKKHPPTLYSVLNCYYKNKVQQPKPSFILWAENLEKSARDAAKTPNLLILNNPALANDISRFWNEVQNGDKLLLNGCAYMSFYKAYSDAAIDTQSFVANPSMSPNELLTKDFVVRNRAAWAAMLENKGLDPEKENLAYLGSSDISAQHFTKFLKYRTDLAKARLLFCLGAGFGKKYQGIDCTKLYGLVSNDRFDPDRPEEITVDAEKYTDFLKAEVDLASSDLSKFIDKKEALSLQEAARRNKKDIDFRKEQYPYLKQFLDGKFGNSFGSVK